MTHAPNSLEFSRLIPLREVPDEGRAYRFEANEAERAAIARRLDLIALESLQARFNVTPEGPGALVEGGFEAAVVQRCVVTMEPVRSTVSGDISQRFAAGPATASRDLDEIEIDALAEDPPEPLVNGAMELGELMVEHLSLSLDPYPRTAGAKADLPHEVAGGPDSPFAKLRRLKNSATED